MPITFPCPTCGTQVRTAENMVGQNVRCPKCLAVIVVPGGSAGIPEAMPVAPMSALTKACPFCGEQVLEVARKCKHCGETIDVVLRAAEEAQRAAERHAAAPTVYMNAAGGSGDGKFLGCGIQAWLGVGFLALVCCGSLYEAARMTKPEPSKPTPSTAKEANEGIQVPDE